MRGMSDESYLRAIDGLCYHGELLSDCLPLPCLTWTEVAPCVARFSPLAPSQFSGLIFKIEALQHHPPTYGPGPPPTAALPFETLHRSSRQRSTMHLLLPSCSRS